MRTYPANINTACPFSDAVAGNVGKEKKEPQDIFIKPVFYRRKLSSRTSATCRHIYSPQKSFPRGSSLGRGHRGAFGRRPTGSSEDFIFWKESGALLWCPRDWEMQRHRDKGGAPRFIDRGRPVGPLSALLGLSSLHQDGSLILQTLLSSFSLFARSNHRRFIKTRLEVRSLQILSFRVIELLQVTHTAGDGACFRQIGVIFFSSQVGAGFSMEWWLNLSWILQRLLSPSFDIQTYLYCTEIRTTQLQK